MPELHPAAIVHRDPGALLDRCDIGGVRRLYREPGYESGAIVPAGDWAPMSADLPRRYAPTSFTREGGMVEFFRLPADVIALPELTSLVDTLGDPEAIPLAATYDPPDEPVTHRLPTSGLRPGLHIDNRENASFTDCAFARRRLCVNMGPGSRYLFLVTTPITSMCKAVYDRYENHHPHTGDFGLYLTERKRASVLRIRIDPGEGWIAPTALLPFDESTEGERLPSTTASRLGRWRRGRLRPLI
ncbi:hypothetical protein [Kitasatospora brasiliensis]|uniref:hypothetical protein n=1 Tax=Kitasatospora brasiliensis TaxID=3058040 RepID=UPI00292F49EA|nr:hypothetical protein [Kitasatospora sp. K002]